MIKTIELLDGTILTLSKPVSLDCLSKHSFMLSDKTIFRGSKYTLGKHPIDYTKAIELSSYNCTDISDVVFGNTYKRCEANPSAQGVYDLVTTVCNIPTPPPSPPSPPTPDPTPPFPECYTYLGSEWYKPEAVGDKKFTRCSFGAPGYYKNICTSSIIKIENPPNPESAHPEKNLFRCSWQTSNPYSPKCYFDPKSKPWDPAAGTHLPLCPTPAPCFTNLGIVEASCNAVEFQNPYPLRPPHHSPTYKRIGGPCKAGCWNAAGKHDCSWGLVTASGYDIPDSQFYNWNPGLGFGSGPYQFHCTWITPEKGTPYCDWSTDLRPSKQAVGSGNTPEDFAWHDDERPICTPAPTPAPTPVPTPAFPKNSVCFWDKYQKRPYEILYNQDKLAIICSSGSLKAPEDISSVCNYYYFDDDNNSQRDKGQYCCRDAVTKCGKRSKVQGISGLVITPYAEASSSITNFSNPNITYLTIPKNDNNFYGNYFAKYLSDISFSMEPKQDDIVNAHLRCAGYCDSSSECKGYNIYQKSSNIWHCEFVSENAEYKSEFCLTKIRDGEPTEQFYAKPVQNLYFNVTY